MTPADGPAKESAAPVVELGLDSWCSYPGGTITVYVVDHSTPKIENLKISLLTREGEPVAEAAPFNGTAILLVPRTVRRGDYLLCIWRGSLCLEAVPWKLTSREVTELSRRVLLASVMRIDALAAAQDPEGDPAEVRHLADGAEYLYVRSGEARTARLMWKEISDAFHHRGLHLDASQATTRVRMLEPGPRIARAAPATRTRPSLGFVRKALEALGYSNKPAAVQVKVDVTRLHEHFASQLRFFLARESRPRHQVANRLVDIFVCWLRDPPEKLSQADDRISRTPLPLLNEANRRAGKENERTTQIDNKAPDWLLAQSGTLSPADTVEWLAYREQVRRSLTSLRPEEREAVLLHRMGYSVKEIATHLGLSVSSLRESLLRGYLALKASSPLEK